MKRASWRVMVLTLGALFCLAGSLAAAPQFTAVEVPGLGGDWSRGECINERGQVAGYAETPGGYYHAFFWDRTAAPQDLGTLGG